MSITAAKILVTEDDAFLRDGLCETLQREGYEVKSAKNSSSAKEALSKEKFNLIILDVMLPDGWIALLKT